MPKQIKLTDSVAAMLEERARRDELSLAGEVNKLLTEGGGSDLSGRLDYLENYLDKKFEELLSAINDTAVDRVAGGAGGGRAPGEKKYLDWDNFRYIVYELLKEGDEEWTSKQSYLAIENLDDEIHVYEKNGSLWVDDYYGRPSCILNISPRVREAIDKNFTFDD